VVNQITEMAEGKVSREDVYSKAVRAGKRTYFFDVKSTRSKDLYLTITESKKRFADDGKFTYEKHKLFLYKEDFDKFIEGLKDTIEEIETLRDSGDFASDEDVKTEDSTENKNDEDFTDVKFEDL